jgi:lipopolysaccharide transport system ATP-binding protein
MSSDIAIKVDNLCKFYHIYDQPRDRLWQMLMRGRKQFYREFWALNDVTFTIQKGETVGIIGRNGSGKSTLLQLICGTLNPTSGSILINGKVAALLELGAGFNPEFTGKENVYLAASLYGLKEETITSRFKQIQDFADIGDFIEQPVKTYSSGMFLRLAFAVIAHVDADILVIDEALAVGDAFFTQKCMRFLRKFMENGTLLFVSHDSSAVVNLCQRAIWLEEGRMKLIDNSKSVIEHYLAALNDSTIVQSIAEPVESTQDSRNLNKVKIVRDHRLDFINSSNLRNDLQVFEFTPNISEFGARGATIVDVTLIDTEGKQLLWIVGGEEVILRIEVKSNQLIKGAIVGFYFNDRLGQNIFGDNTYLTYLYNPIILQPNQHIIVSFIFVMPILPRGDYTVSVAIAEGTQDEHIQHHWLYDALVLKSHSSSVCTGLLGIPMKDISFEFVNLNR